jgi:hypothetical protein
MDRSRFITPSAYRAPAVHLLPASLSASRALAAASTATPARSTKPTRLSPKIKFCGHRQSEIRNLERLGSCRVSINIAEVGRECSASGDFPALSWPPSLMFGNVRMVGGAVRNMTARLAEYLDLAQLGIGLVRES